MNKNTKLYIHVANSIKNKITEGIYPVGGKIPTEHRLMEEYTVGRETVRHALSLLEKDGYIVRKPGRGTTVIRQSHLDPMEPLLSYSAEMISKGMEPTSLVLKIGEKKAGNDSKLLQCREDERIIEVYRIRFADGIPMAYERSIMIKKYIKELTYLDAMGSIYQFLVHKCGVKVSSVKQEIKSSAATEEEAKYLGIDQGDPVLTMKRTINNLDGVPVYFLEFTFRGDMYTFKTEVKL